jgi:hypothetical protein
LPKAEERHKLWLHDQWRRGIWLKNKKDMDLLTTVRIDVLGSLRTLALDLGSVLSVYSSQATSVGLETLDNISHADLTHVRQDRPDSSMFELSVEA